MNTLKQDGLYNLKIHYIWTFFSSVLFLAPVITLFYKNYGLDINGILILSACFTIFSTLLEIPTSLIGDSLPRRYILRASVLTSFISFLIYFFFPNIFMFYIAVFFSALGNALWSGVGHSKLQEDLESSEMQNQFGKVIGRLIALENIGKLFTPFVIYFVLKYYENNGYHILAGLDVISWSIAIYFVFKFRKTKDINLLQNKSFKEKINIQKNVFKKAFSFFISSENLIILLFLLILGNNLGYLSKILLPNLVENGIEDFLSSYVVWFIVFAGILGNLLPDKLSKYFSYKKIFVFIIGINAFFHFLTYYFFDNKIILIYLFVFISFLIGIYGPVWNHLLMNYSKISEKATLRSMFFLILGIFEASFLYISSFFEIKQVLLFLFIMMGIGFIIGIIKFSKQKNKKNQI